MANYGLKVFNISDSTQPLEVAAYRTACDLYGQVRNIALAGNYGYLSSGSGVDIFDLSQPERPTRLGSLLTPGYVNWVQVVGNTAYLAESERGLQIYDLSNPAHPALLGEHRTQNGADRVTVAGRFAFLTSSYWGPIEVFDISVPQSPLRVGYSTTNYYAFAARLHEGKLFVAAGGAGLRVLEMKSTRLLAPPVVSGEFIILSWAGAPGVKLQKTTSLSPSAWQDVPGSEGQSRVQLPLADSTAFFRLLQP